MNIKQAKEEIKHTVEAYLSKDTMGEYVIPAIRQRPILLMGPPGIGKTQIMEQVARECRIGLVAYTITHHTRQSAVGLPFIREEEYDGKTYSVTEYTMSEIIASIYRKRKESGLTEGILFIDEINCVSETLAPTMLQFLQCKTFGNQAVPKGWVIVAAGNPPEYNKSVRDFDMVTLDRVRYMQIEADYSVWREYAKENQVHGAILSYLALRPKNFYRVETDVDGMKFVTARGWEDLSSLMKVYEHRKIPVDESVIREYLHHEDVAEDAASYFELYRKYQDDYGIHDILSGEVAPEIYARLDAAGFDERLCVVNLLLDALSGYFKRTAGEKYIADAWFAFLKNFRSRVEAEESPKKCYEFLLAEKEAQVRRELAGGLYTKETAEFERYLLKQLAEHVPAEDLSPKESFEWARKGFAAQTAGLEKTEHKTEEVLEYAFDFMEQAFENGQEMVIFVTELTLDTNAVLYLAEHGCGRYLKYKEELLIGTKRTRLLEELER